jgi:hypothetical protein
MAAEPRVPGTLISADAHGAAFYDVKNRPWRAEDGCVVGDLWSPCRFGENKATHRRFTPIGTTRDRSGLLRRAARIQPIGASERIGQNVPPPVRQYELRLNDDHKTNPATLSRQLDHAVEV